MAFAGVLERFDLTWCWPTSGASWRCWWPPGHDGRCGRGHGPPWGARQLTGAVGRSAAPRRRHSFHPPPSARRSTRSADRVLFGNDCRRLPLPVTRPQAIRRVGLSPADEARCWAGTPPAGNRPPRGPVPGSGRPPHEATLAHVVVGLTLSALWRFGIRQRSRRSGSAPVSISAHLHAAEAEIGLGKTYDAGGCLLGSSDAMPALVARLDGCLRTPTLTPRSSVKFKVISSFSLSLSRQPYVTPA
jgi:hypothetical protein